MTAAIRTAPPACLSLTLVAALALFLMGCGAQPLNTITVSPATGATILTSKGQQAQFTAMGQYTASKRIQSTKNITASVTWTSSVTSVATITAAGMVTAVGDGTTVITASMMGGSGMLAGISNVAVSGSGTGTGTTPGTRTLTSLTITPATQQLTGSGQTGQLLAIGNFTGGAPATLDMTSMVAWSSSNVGVATISSHGLATAVGNGTTTITASATATGGAVITSTASTITVSGAGTGTAGRDLSSIAITPALQAMSNLGEFAQFIAIGTYSSGIPATVDLTNAVTWSSSDSTVAGITSTGLATAGVNGTTTITAMGKAASGAVISTSAIVTVTASAGTPLVTRDLTSIAISPAAETLTVAKQTAQFLAIGSYNSGQPIANLTTGGLVIWQSSNPSVATIDVNGGLVTALADGTTTITATATSPFSHSTITSSALVTVTGTGTNAGMRTLKSILITPGDLTLGAPALPGQFIAIGTFEGGVPATAELTSDPSLKWSSSNHAIATITQTGGLATSVGPGTTNIAATYADPNNGGNVVSAYATVTVASFATPGLTALQIVPGSQTVSSVGETAQYIAIGTFNNGTPLTRDLTKDGSLKWASSDVTVASVNATGLATAVYSALVGGSTTITATYIDPGNGSVKVFSAGFTFSGSAPANKLPLLSVYLVGTGTGTVTSFPTPIDCYNFTGSPALHTCLGNFSPTAQVILTAVPSADSTFDPLTGWSSNCKDVTLVLPFQCTISMTNPDPDTGKPIIANQPVGVIFNLR